MSELETIRHVKAILWSNQEHPNGKPDFVAKGVEPPNAEELSFNVWVQTHFDVFGAELEGGERGVLLVAEIFHQGCKDYRLDEPDTGTPTMGAAWYQVCRMGKTLAAYSYRVLAGLRTGQYGYHQLAIFLPFRGLTHERLTKAGRFADTVLRSRGRSRVA